MWYWFAGYLLLFIIFLVILWVYSHRRLVMNNSLLIDRKINWRISLLLFVSFLISIDDILTKTIECICAKYRTLMKLCWLSIFVHRNREVVFDRRALSILSVLAKKKRWITMPAKETAMECFLIAVETNRRCSVARRIIAAPLISFCEVSYCSCWPSLSLSLSLVCYYCWALCQRRSQYLENSRGSTRARFRCCCIIICFYFNSN